MDRYRGAAIAAGSLFIVATVTDLISRVVLVQPNVADPVDLTTISANADQVLLGAFLLFIGAISAVGIAIALYPILRRHSEGLAIGSVGFRLMEGALYVGIVVCLLVLVAVSQEAADAAAVATPVLQAQAVVLLAARDSLGEVAVLAFGTGALLYYWVFYRTRLIPRWLSVWGLAAVVSVMLSGILVMLERVEPMSTVQVVLALPIFLQEMVLAVWLIARGFDRSVDVPASVGDPSGWRVDPGSAQGSAA